TAHASDYAGIKSHFCKPMWMKNKGVISNGNLFSTAGVSNATDGSLTVINKLFGREVMKKVIDDIHYPYSSPREEHQSNAVDKGNIASIAKKIFLKDNRSIGILLQPGINEFEMAGIMDTYNRTLPESIVSVSENGLPVKSKYGLTLIPTANPDNADLDE